MPTSDEEGQKQSERTCIDVIKEAPNEDEETNKGTEHAANEDIRPSAQKMKEAEEGDKKFEFNPPEFGEDKEMEDAKVDLEAIEIECSPEQNPIVIDARDLNIDEENSNNFSRS